MMKCVLCAIVISGLLQCSIAESNVISEVSKETKQTRVHDKKLMQRIDFGNAFIMGQTIKSGAVYLLKRKKSDIKSMLKKRESYREEILEDFSAQGLKAKE